MQSLEKINKLKNILDSEMKDNEFIWLYIFWQAPIEKFAMGFAGRISRMRKAEMEFAQGFSTTPRGVAEDEYTHEKGMALELSITRVGSTP